MNARSRPDARDANGIAKSLTSGVSRASGTSATPCLYECVITHARIAPVRSVFTYASFMWLIDIDAPPRVPWPLGPLARFDARDHFSGDTPVRVGLERAAAEGGFDITGGGRVLMLTQARVLGYVFNPLTLYWCHDAHDRLACVVAEVHNTYGGRHAYVVRTDERGIAATGKEFHVSPFLSVSGTYRMALPEPDVELALTVTLDQPGARPFVARVRGERRPYTVRSLLGSTLRHPMAPLAGAARIRRRGIGLWLRKVPVVRHRTGGSLR